MEEQKEEDLSFDQCLWNKVEPVHKRFKRKYEYFDNVIEIFNRILSSLKDYQKVISGLISKNYILFPEQDFTEGVALYSIKKILELEFNQLGLNIELLKKNLTENFRKQKEERRILEKDTYAQFLKVLAKYNDSKALMEKNKSKYHQSVKVAESSLKTSKSMKIKNINNSQDMILTIQKLEDKAKELLVEAKKNLDKYSISIRDANKNREESIEKQSNILKMYQSLDLKDGELITSIMNDLYNRLKEENDAKKKLLDELEQIIKNINLKKDKEDFIKLHKSEDKPDDLINLVQYEPPIDFEKASNPEEYKINHEIIVTMKSVIPDIMPNFDIEKENRKQEMRELSKKIFAINVAFTDDEKKKLMEYLEQKWSQTYFLIYLSRQRTNGRFARSEKLVKDLAEILNLILQTSEKEKDYEAARNCMILSQTYYYDEKDKEGNVKKKYLLEFILPYKWLRTPDFWRGLIEKMISLEIEKFVETNPDEPSLFDEKNEKSRERLSNFCFSQLLPYSNNMVEFFLDNRIVVKIIDEFVEKYHVQKEFADSIYGVVNSNPEEIEKIRQEYKNNPNIENELLSLEEVKKQRGLG